MKPFRPPGDDLGVSGRGAAGCQPLAFTLRVLRAFKRNQGMLLSGAVA